MCKLLKFFAILSTCLFLLACASKSGRKEQPRLIVKHVFTNGLPDPYDGGIPDVRHDYYYAYNYTDADYTLFEKMLDTLSIDKAYRYHSYYFFKYNEELPDTLDLNNEMEDPYGDHLQNAPGSAKYKKYAILGFTFVRGFVSQADEVRKEKLIPENYRITTYGDNGFDERYFLKDSISGNLIEVDRSVVSIPDSGIRGVE